MPKPNISINRWSALSLKDRADLIKLFTQNGVTSLSKMKDIFNSDIEHALSSDKDFVQRLRDYPNTPLIENEDGSHSSHLMNSGEVDGKGVVWPSIQRNNGELRDFRNSSDGGLDNAISQNDTLQMHPASARFYAENYKRYYPNIKDYGGPLLYPFSKKVIPAVRYGKGGGTKKWKGLSKSYQATVIERAKEMNIPEKEVASWYDAGKLDAALSVLYQGYHTNGRVRNNDSPTQEGSEALEARMNRSVYNSKDRRRPNMPYAIPYIQEKEIKVRGVGRVPTNALDSLAKYAGITGVPLSEALGLAAQETAFGAAPYINYDTEGVDKRELGNSSYFRNYGVIPAENLVRDFRYNTADWRGNFIDWSTPPLQHALEYWKAGNYNRGDKNHTSDVKAKGEAVMKDPAIQKWMQESRYVKKK